MSDRAPLTRAEVEEMRQSVLKTVGDLFDKFEYGEDGRVVNRFDLEQSREFINVQLAHGRQMLVPTTESVLLRVHPSAIQHAQTLAQSVANEGPANPAEARRRKNAVALIEWLSQYFVVRPPHHGNFQLLKLLMIYAPKFSADERLLAMSMLPPEQQEAFVWDFKSRHSSAGIPEPEPVA